MTTAVQLALLEKRVDKAIEDLTETYPFLAERRGGTKKQQENEERPDELALTTLREIRERLSA